MTSEVLNSWLVLGVTGIVIVWNFLHCFNGVISIIVDFERIKLLSNLI